MAIAGTWPVVWKPLNINAEIVCRKEAFGPVCEWSGERNGVAHVYLEAIEHGGFVHVEGDRLKVGGLWLRVLGRRPDSKTVYVGLDSPQNELYLLYRRIAYGLLRFVFRCELAVRAFMLRPVELGEYLPFTRWLSEQL